MSMSSEDAVLIALGGNALILPGEKGYIEEQFVHTAACMRPIATLVSQGVPVVITHGNGPIVGNILLRNECAKEYIPPMPLYICVADSQGGIGAMMAQSLRNELMRLAIERTVAAIVTHVVVDQSNPAFRNPTKPIGPYYSEEEARSYRDRMGWEMRNIPGRGWRRLVPSPRPRKIIELDAVRTCLERGAIPIAAGGGGIPVIEDGRIRGVDAVVDKDLSASLLARGLGLKRFAILTDVDGVYLNWNSREQERMKRLTVAEAGRLLLEGQFPPGDMGPKIEAAVEFIESGGREVVVTKPELLLEALKGEAGTVITA